MFRTIVSVVRRLFGSEPLADHRMEYRYRCCGCFEVSGEKLVPPKTDEERLRIIACGKCGQENRLTLPLLREEFASDTQAQAG